MLNIPEVEVRYSIFEHLKMYLRHNWFIVYRRYYLNYKESCTLPMNIDRRKGDNYRSLNGLAKKKTFDRSSPCPGFYFLVDVAVVVHRRLTKRHTLTLSIFRYSIQL